MCGNACITNSQLGISGNQKEESLHHIRGRHLHKRLERRFSRGGGPHGASLLRTSSIVVSPEELWHFKSRLFSLRPALLLSWQQRRQLAGVQWTKLAREPEWWSWPQSHGLSTRLSLLRASSKATFASLEGAFLNEWFVEHGTWDAVCKTWKQIWKSILSCLFSLPRSHMSSNQRPCVLFFPQVVDFSLSRC